MTRLAIPIFDHAHPIYFWLAFNFCESESTGKKISLFDLRVLLHDWPHPFLKMPTPNIFNHVLICMNLYQHVKNQLTSSVHSSDALNFWLQRPDWPYPFLTMPYQKTFNQLLIFVNLYQHAKNKPVSSFALGR